MNVQHFSLHEIMVDGDVSRDDVVVTSDAYWKWNRAEKHSIQDQDLGDVFDRDPEVLIIGTGMEGNLELPESIKEDIENQDIELHVKTTEEALDTYDELKEQYTVIALLHIGC